MKTKIILLPLLMSFSILSQAQSEHKLSELLDFVRTKKVITGDWKNNLAEGEIEGSPYLNETFAEGTVYTIQNDKYTGIPLRYNAYNDEIEFRNEKDEILALYPPESIDKVEIGNLKMEYIPYIFAKNTRNGYFELIAKGNASLFVKHEIVFKDAEEPGAYKEAAPARFVKNPDAYYIQINNEPAEVVSNKKSLLEILSDQYDEIDTFFKKNKIKTNNIDDLTKLVKYYNTL